MSNEFAISAVTLTLRNLLDKVKELKDSDVMDEVPDNVKPKAQILVTNLPLDEAYEFEQGKNQVNIFLYHVEHSASWRNREIPGRIKNGESGNPPLGLNLYYLITAYGEDKNETIGHMLLGKAMSILHDHPVLSKEEIKDALSISRLHEQIERIRITPQPISIDEVSKLWTGFQSQYKLSVAYQVSVILIESTRPTTTPLPVLRRGIDDRGVILEPSVISGFPIIDSISFPAKQNAAQLGDTITIKGSLLKGDTTLIRFHNRRLENIIERPILPGATDGEIKVQIPNTPVDWVAGVYSATAVVTRGTKTKTSNSFPFTLLPTIALPIVIAPGSPPGENNYLATVSFNPTLIEAQVANLLLGNREFKPDEYEPPVNALTFHLNDVEDGEHYFRLRIDGADSLFIDTTVSPPVFRASNKIVLP